MSKDPEAQNRLVCFKHCPSSAQVGRGRGETETCDGEIDMNHGS